jgi:hypothetical protein
MNRAPGSEEKSETTRRPQEASEHMSDPRLTEFVRALAQSAAMEIEPTSLPIGQNSCNGVESSLSRLARPAAQVR